MPEAGTSCSTTPNKVERRPHAAAATSSRSRMSIIVMDTGTAHQPSVASTRPLRIAKKYTLDDFNFVKVLGKGSYGKVESLFLVQSQIGGRGLGNGLGASQK